MARISKPIVATEEQRQTLLVMSRSLKMEKRYTLRAHVILLSLEGKSLDDIIILSGMSRPIVNKWRQRFRQFGIEGLKDAQRSGKPSVISARQKAMVIQKACEKPSGGYTNWSQARIGKQTGMSQSRVHQILKQADLKPHKIEYWCGKSPDPEFESKMMNIVGLYMNPPENAIVLCVDEKTQIQALDRTQPVLPLKEKAPKRLTVTYKRNGTVALIAALAVHSGEITGKTMKSNNSENFLSFLKKLDRAYRNKTLHIIVDNLSVHKNAKVKEWLASKRKVRLHFTPTYSSWLNQSELAKLAIESNDKSIRKAAISRLTNQELLTQVAIHPTQVAIFPESFRRKSDGSRELILSKLSPEQSFNVKTYLEIIETSPSWLDRAVEKLEKVTDQKLITKLAASQSDLGPGGSCEVSRRFYNLS